MGFSKFLAAVCVVFGLTSGVHAASFEEVQKLYIEGQYDAAAQLGEEVGTAPSLALAARSLLGKINLQTRDDRKMAEIDKAIALAEAALALDPENVEGHLQIATAYGFKARLLSMLRAKIAKLPEKSKHHLDQTIAIDPENAWGWSFIGAWHWEVVRKGGEGMARSLFGATVEDGNQAFEKALVLDDANPYVPYLYALTLMTKNIYTHEARARELLVATSQIDPTSHQAEITVARANAILKALDAEDYQSALDQVTDYQGLKPMKLPRKT